MWFIYSKFTRVRYAVNVHFGTLISIENNITTKDESSTVKPAHVVTYIKQSPVLKGHFFLVLS